MDCFDIFIKEVKDIEKDLDVDKFISALKDRSFDKIKEIMNKYLNDKEYQERLRKIYDKYILEGLYKIINSDGDKNV